MNLVKDGRMEGQSSLGKQLAQFLQKSKGKGQENQPENVNVRYSQALAGYLDQDLGLKWRGDVKKERFEEICSPIEYL